MEIQRFFSILILPSIALKRWNFLYKLDFKSKILAKFLLKIHFLSAYKNMAIKQQIIHVAIQKVCHLHNGLFHSIPFDLWGHFFNFTLSPSLSYSLEMTNYRMKEKKVFSLYDCFSKSSYIKVGRELHL